MGRSFVRVFVAVAAVSAVLQPGPAAADTFTFRNDGTISLPGSGYANGTPASSRITVAGVRSAEKITMKIHGLTHPTPSNFAAVLVAPSGNKVSLIHNTGADHDVNDITLTFADGGANLPNDSSPLTGGTYRPRGGFPFGDEPCKSPVGSTMKSLNVKGKLNGVWTLCLYDQYDQDTSTGFIDGGWSLTFKKARGSGGGGDGGSTPCGAPLCDWEVPFSVSQFGLQVKPEPDPNLDNTQMTLQGTLRFDNKPKADRGTIGTLDTLLFVQTDEYESGDQAATLFETAGPSGAPFGVYVRKSDPKIGLGLVHHRGGLAGCPPENTIGLLQFKDRSDGRDVTKFSSFEEDDFPSADCYLNRAFVNGGRGAVSVDIGDPRAVPE